MRENLALLTLRVGFGGIMAFGHGLQKLMKWNELSQNFPDPIGAGSQVALGLAIFAELFCALAVALGLFTRFAALPLIVTMTIAGFVVMAGKPFGEREMAFLFLIPFIAIALLGGGRYSLDQLRGPKRG